MPDYKSMYFKMFNRITDAIRILQKAQQEGEDSYIESDDVTLVLIKNEENGKYDHE